LPTVQASTATPVRWQSKFTRCSAVAACNSVAVFVHPVQWLQKAQEAPTPASEQQQQQSFSGMKTPQQQTSAQPRAPAGVDAAKSSSAPGSRASPVPGAAQANMSSSPAQSSAHSLLRAPSSPVGPGMGQGGAGPGHREKGVKARRAAAGSEVGPVAQHAAGFAVQAAGADLWRASPCSVFHAVILLAHSSHSCKPQLKGQLIGYLMSAWAFSRPTCCCACPASYPACSSNRL
jgi:hypothetical protein